MKRKLLSVITALALCLSLLPGTALAVDETGVTFANRENSVTLTDGKFYVAAADNNGITQQEDEPTGDPYLAYSGGTLTVHGAFETTANITVNSNLTITGGEGSSLNVTAPHSCTVYLANDSTLTLDGSVDFTANNSNGLVITSHDSTGTFAAAGSYSGDIKINSTGNAPAVFGVPMDVKNSGSITITGMMTSMQSAVLNSEGPVSITSSGSIAAAELSIKGADVTLEQTADAPVFAGRSLNIEATGNVTITNENGTGSAPALRGTTVISAGGDVEISSNGVPASFVYSTDATYDLTVKNATTVSITGASDYSSAFFPVPVTFENCGSVTVEDSGNGELLGEGGSITSDVPVHVTKNIDPNGSAYIYSDGKLWIYNSSKNINPNPSNSAMAWEAGNGWVFYEPPTDENPTAKLTLDNAEYPDGAIGLNTDVSVEVKGRNHVGGIGITSPGSMKLNIQGGATLNALVIDNSAEGETRYTVYGKAKLLDDFYLYVGADPNNPTDKYYLTVLRGAELTIPKMSDEGSEIPGLTIYDADKAYLRNEGTIVNNGTVALTGNAAQGNVSQTIKSLGLTGTGTVVVGEMDEYGNLGDVKETYFNSGVKLLEPVITLDLTTNNDYTEAWDTKGYKWTDVVRDETSGDITSAKLTLKEGFNASEVILPDAAVEIVSEGECLIGELLIADSSGANHTQLTLSGKGPLNIQQHVEICGGTENSLTVAQGAQVQVTGGVTVGAASGVDGEVTVNGTLTAAGDSRYAGVRTGKVKVGSSGTLRVSGEMGVLLAGMGTDSADEKDFAGAFTVQPGGRFEARCDPTVILASPEGLVFRENSETEVIVLPTGYLPSNCVLKFSNGKKELTIPGDGSLFNISVDNVPRPSGGGGGGGVSTYAVTVEKSEHGKVTSDRTNAGSGSTVTLTVTPDGGYVLSVLTVTDSQGNEITLTAQGDGKYTFTMPSRAVTVRAAFACTGGADCPSRAFSDLDTGEWYHEAVDYVLRNDLMDGYDNGLFGPNDTLTRAQFVQILFNKEGRPVVNYLLRYDDVAPGAWYTEAVRWATSLGIAGGYGNGVFGPNDNITREQLVVMLWRYAGSPAATEKELHFSDAGKASGYALEALRWAAESGVLNDRDGTLEPTGQVTRAETAQMLKIFMEGQ